MEEWRDVKGFESLYKVSNMGQVMNKHGDIMHQANNGVGYLQVQLSKDGKSKHFYVHRIVANAFIENPENKPQINHKDGNKQNNNVDNLEWCTNRENSIHACTRSPRRKKGVVQLDAKTFQEIKKFQTIQQAERQTGIRHERISGACRETKHTAGGYLWRYATR